MSAAVEEYPEYAWPRHWGYHSQPHHDTQACPRCQREADHIEAHLGCMCIDHRWLLRDVGSPAVPALVWVCSVCWRVMGPSWDGAA